MKVRAVNLLFVIVLTLTARFDAPAQTGRNETIKLTAAAAAVTVDGQLDDREWRDALGFDLVGGGRLLLKYDGEYFYVALRGVERGSTQLYLSDDASRDVDILHASAALGTSVYRPDRKGFWQPANPFLWELRDRELTEATKEKMNAYLAKNSWVANNNNMNRQSGVEFKIRTRAAAAERRFAVVHVAGEEKLFFPAALADDALKSPLAFGDTRPDLKFDLRRWARIVLEKKPSK
jgi:hypothetical protein